MESTLIISEIVFNLTVSIAVIVIMILCSIVTYRLIHITKEFEKLTHNLNHISSETGERINDILDRFSNLPLLSYFFKKNSSLYSRKGRSKPNTFNGIKNER